MYKGGFSFYYDFYFSWVDIKLYIQFLWLVLDLFFILYFYVIYR